MTVVWIAVLSLVGTLAGFLLGGLTIVLLPVDYFTAPDQDYRWRRLHPALGWTVRIARNLLGAALVLLGIVLLFLPGQGLLTIVVGLMLLDLPGKHRLLRRVLGRPGFLQAANRLRRWVGRAPLQGDTFAGDDRMGP